MVARIMLFSCLFLLSACNTEPIQTHVMVVTCPDGSTAQVMDSDLDGVPDSEFCDLGTEYCVPEDSKVGYCRWGVQQTICCAFGQGPGWGYGG
jgi:hypothetical protein